MKNIPPNIIATVKTMNKLKEGDHDKFVDFASEFFRTLIINPSILLPEIIEKFPHLNYVSYWPNIKLAEENDFIYMADLTIKYCSGPIDIPTIKVFMTRDYKRILGLLQKNSLGPLITSKYFSSPRLVNYIKQCFAEHHRQYNIQHNNVGYSQCNNTQHNHSQYYDKFIDYDHYFVNKHLIDCKNDQTVDYKKNQYDDRFDYNSEFIISDDPYYQ